MRSGSKVSIHHHKEVISRDFVDGTIVESFSIYRGNNTYLITIYDKGTQNAHRYDIHCQKQNDSNDWKSIEPLCN